MIVRRMIWVFLFLLYTQDESLAYLPMETHPELTRVAFIKSELEKTLSDELDVDFKKVYKDPLGKRSPQTLIEWLRLGSRFEDSGLRGQNHFYNPINGAGVNEVIVFSFYPTVGAPAKDWVFSDAGYLRGAGDYTMDNFCSDSHNDFKKSGRGVAYCRFLTAKEIM